MRRLMRVVAIGGGFGSLVMTLAYAAYALGNMSGHSGFPAKLLFFPLHLFVLALAVISILLDHRAREGMRPLVCMSLLLSLGGAGFLIFLDRVGVLREYDTWVKSGLNEPSQYSHVFILVYLGLLFVFTVFVGVFIRGLTRGSRREFGENLKVENRTV